MPINNFQETLILTTTTFIDSLHMMASMELHVANKIFSPIQSFPRIWRQHKMLLNEHDKLQ